MRDERIGVFGGTFDPVHHGHLLIASELGHALQLERILFAPAGDPPHKPGIPLSRADDRLKMLRLAIAGRDPFGIDSTDLERDGPSYSVDLLRLIAAKYPTARLFFLMGSDSLRDLLLWKDPEKIVALAELAVARRPGVDFDLDRLLASLPAARGRIHLLDVPQIDVASSDIRRRAAAGDPIAFHVPPEVERFIVEHRLYRTDSD